MKITRRQLRRIIKEAVQEQSIDYRFADQADEGDQVIEPSGKIHMLHGGGRPGPDFDEWAERNVGESIEELVNKGWVIARNARFFDSPDFGKVSNAVMRAIVDLVLGAAPAWVGEHPLSRRLDGGEGEDILLYFTRPGTWAGDPNRGGAHEREGEPVRLGDFIRDYGTRADVERMENIFATAQSWQDRQGRR